MEALILDVWKVVSPLLSWFTDLLASPTANWLQGIIAGAIGAVAGSLGTQWVISSSERTRDARSELRAINRAINLCFTSTNHALGLKRQLVKPMEDRYEAVLAKAKSPRPPNGEPIAIDLDLVSIPAGSLPINRLESLMVEGINIGGRGLVAAFHLSGAYSSLVEAVAQRSALVNEFRNSTAQDKLPHLYLGLADRQGNVDSRFADNVGAIARYTDDVIFFSNILAKDLHKHGSRLIRRHRWSLGSPRKVLDSFNWDDDADGLVPDEREYERWLVGFPEKRPWWKFWAKPARESADSAATEAVTSSR